MPASEAPPGSLKLFMSSGTHSMGPSPLNFTLETLLRNGSAIDLEKVIHELHEDHPALV